MDYKLCLSSGKRRQTSRTPAGGESIHWHFVETVSLEPLSIFWLLYAPDTPPWQPSCALGSRWLPSWNTQRPSTSLAPLGLSSLWRFPFLTVGTSSSFIDWFSWFSTHHLPSPAYTSSEAIAFTHIYAGGFRLKSHNPPFLLTKKKFSPESPSSTSRSTCWVFYEAFPVGSLTEMEKKSI